MESSFAQAIDTWHDFYLMAGTAGATLIGLLFVSVSLHIDLLTDPAAAGVLATARRAFVSFIIVVLIALFFLVPSQSHTGLGLPLLACGMVYLAQTVQVMGILRRDRMRISDLLGGNSDLGRFSLGLVGSAGLLIIAGTILNGSTRYLGWLVGVIAVVLVGAAMSCWSLLLDLALAKRRREAQHHPEPPAPSPSGPPR